MQYDDSPFGLLERRRSQLSAQAENTARMAKTYATWTTKGIGEIFVPTVIAFDVVFVEEPCFTSGIALAPGVELVTGHYPRAYAGVYEWSMNTDGHYKGAYLYFVVDTIGPGQVLGQEPSYEIIHHLAWEGTAIKDLPFHLLDL
jgi:hypothetical protein